MTELVFGIFIGAFLMAVIYTIVRVIQTSSGTLLIDHSNPEKDVYRFQINDLDKLSKKREVRLRVDNNADLSQE